MDHRPHRDHIRTKAAGLFHVDVNLPIDTGQGAGVFNLDQSVGVSEFLIYDFGRNQQVFPIAAGQTHIQRFAGCRPHVGIQQVYLNARDGLEAGFNFSHDCLAAAPFVPGFQFNLHLTDGVKRGNGAAGVLVQATRTGKGKSAFHSFHRQNFYLGLTHQRVLFVKRQIAPRPDIGDGAFRFRINEKLDPVVVFAKIVED